MMDEPTLYLILCVISFTAIIHMAWSLINEITTILQINVFSLTEEQLKAQTK